MNDEEIQIRVQQIREELERMQPDIEQGVQDRFGQDMANLANNHQGVLGNVQAAEEDGNAPNVPEEQQRQIVDRFNENMGNLNNEADAFRLQLNNERIGFLVERYAEDGTEEDRQRIAGLLNVEYVPPVDDAAVEVEEAQVPDQPENGNPPELDGEGETFYDELADFGAGAEGDIAEVDHNDGYEPGDLTTEFNDATGPPGGGGFVP